MPYGVALTADGSEDTRRQPAIRHRLGRRQKARAVVATVKVGRYPEGITILPDQSKAYVANWFSGYVSVIDIASAREIKRIACGAGPRAMALAAGVP